MTDPVTAALVGGGLAAGGSIISSAMAMNQSAAQRAWMAGMDSTKYQRMVADMRAAGLNPILAAGGSPGGAGTPSAPNVGVNLEQLGEGLTSAAKVKAIDAKRVENETKSVNAQLVTAATTQEVNSANAAKAKVEAAVLAKEVDNKVAHRILTEAQTDLTRATARNVRAETPGKETKGAIWDAVRSSGFGKAISETWKYWTSPSQTYATGQGNVNGGLHSAHKVKEYRELGSAHRRGGDLGVQQDPRVSRYRGGR